MSHRHAQAHVNMDSRLRGNDEVRRVQNYSLNAAGPARVVKNSACGAALGNAAE